MKTLRISFLLALVIAFFGSCQKEYSIEGGVLSTLPGTWEFKDSSKFFSGNMDTAFVETTGNTKSLRLQGTSFTGAEDFELILNTTNSSFTVGTYKASLGEVNFEYAKNSVPIYEGNQLFGEFIVTISSISTTNVTGSFTGIAIDSSGVNKTITAGKFTSRYKSGIVGGGPGAGVLGATAGICSPYTISGTYTQGIVMNATNTVELTVTVTTVGNYAISTNTVNGVTFSKSGTFSSLGVQTIRLVGSGTPVNAGDSVYKVTFGTSICNFNIAYGVGSPPATGSLGTAAGVCTPITQSGTFTQGVAVTSANTITVQVNVLSPGSYNITTNSANGISFAKSGVFTATGSQNVVLAATGTPLASGPFTFTVTFTSSTCTFAITFATGTIPTGDYFPTTANSNWVYYSTTGIFFSDSFKVTTTALSSVFNMNSFTQFHSRELSIATPPTDTLYYRKTPNNYFQYLDVSDIFPFDDPVYGEANFLRDNVAQAGTWNSPNYTGSISGIPVTGFLKFTILAKGVPATVGGNAFPDVIKVLTEVYFTLIPGIPQGTIEQWFAKGVGLIYTDADGQDEANIQRYQVF